MAILTGDTVFASGGNPYVYKDSGETDPSTGLRIFDLDPDGDDEGD